jgi:hypothetical protein
MATTDDERWGELLAQARGGNLVVQDEVSVLAALGISPTRSDIFIERIQCEAREQKDNTFVFQRVHYHTVLFLQDLITSVMDPLGLTATEVSPEQLSWFMFRDHGRLCAIALPLEDVFYTQYLSREIPLVDPEILELLRSKRVAVAGCGTVGGAIAQALAHQGVGHLTFSDFDTVAIHNLNRGVHKIPEIGRPKTESLSRILFQTNPFMEQRIIPGGINDANIDQFVDEADVIVSALDNVEVMYLLHQAAYERKIPLILITDVDNRAIFDLFDYRNPKTALFGGRINADDIARLRRGDIDQGALVSKVINPLRVPNRMIQAFLARMRHEVDHFAQRDVAALQSAALSIEAFMRIVSGEPMRRQSGICVGDALDTNTQKWLRRLMRGSILVEAFIELAAAGQDRVQDGTPED